MATSDTSFVPSCSTTTRVLGACISSATANALGTTLSATATAPTDTVVTDLRREVRIVLRFKRTFLTIKRE